MPPEFHNPMLEELRKLNEQVAKQQSLWHTFVYGVFYGLGFFVGSAILAVLALGYLGPWFAHIPVIEQAFTGGHQLIGK